MKEIKGKKVGLNVLFFTIMIKVKEVITDGILTTEENRAWLFQEWKIGQKEVGFHVMDPQIVQILRKF